MQYQSYRWCITSNLNIPYLLKHLDRRSYMSGRVAASASSKAKLGHRCRWISTVACGSKKNVCVICISRVHKSQIFPNQSFRHFSHLWHLLKMRAWITTISHHWHLPLPALVDSLRPGKPQYAGTSPFGTLQCGPLIARKFPPLAQEDILAELGYRSGWPEQTTTASWEFWRFPNSSHKGLAQEAFESGWFASASIDFTCLT